MSEDKSADESKFWFNLKTGKVERGLLAPAPDRVGPFETESDAAKALELLKKRSQQWDEDEKGDS